MGERSLFLVVAGWLLFYGLLIAQISLFVYLFLAMNELSLPFVCLLFFLPPFALLFYFKRVTVGCYARRDREYWIVCAILGAHILAVTTTTAIIIATISKKSLESRNINVVANTLCFTPAALILLLQLTICPSYRQSVLSTSVFIALNVFDGIQIFQAYPVINHWDSDLEADMQIIIIFFACFCLLLTPIGLIRKKLKAFNNGQLEERFKFLAPLEVIGINLPLLVIRLIIFHKYEDEQASSASFFIVKNAVSLLFCTVEFGVFAKWWKWGFVASENAAGEGIAQLEEEADASPRLSHRIV